MRFLPRRRVEYRTVTVPVSGLHIKGLGEKFVTVHNNTDRPARITWTMPGPEPRLVTSDIPPRTHFAFHTRDGKLRADIIELVEEDA